MRVLCLDCGEQLWPHENSLMFYCQNCKKVRYSLSNETMRAIFYEKSGEKNPKESQGVKKAK